MKRATHTLAATLLSLFAPGCLFMGAPVEDDGMAEDPQTVETDEEEEDEEVGDEDGGLTEEEQQNVEDWFEEQEELEELENGFFLDGSWLGTCELPHRGETLEVKLNVGDDGAALANLEGGYGVANVDGLAWRIDATIDDPWVGPWEEEEPAGIYGRIYYVDFERGDHVLRFRVEQAIAGGFVKGECQALEPATDLTAEGTTCALFGTPETDCDDDYYTPTAHGLLQLRDPKA